MKLVKIENWKLVISDEALLVSAFSALWKRDRSVNKTKALLDFTVIYFLCDPRSDYMFIPDEQDRLQSILEQEGITEFKLDDTLMKAIKTYKYLTQTTSYLLIEDSKIAINKLREQLRDLDITKTDDKGKPIYTLNSITSTIKQIPELSIELNKAEKILFQELNEDSEARGNKAKKITEDGIGDFIIRK